MRNEVEEILIGFEREFDRCDGNYKYNRKPVIERLLKLIDKAVKEERERISKMLEEQTEVWLPVQIKPLIKILKPKQDL